MQRSRGGPPGRGGLPQGGRPERPPGGGPPGGGAGGGPRGGRGGRGARGGGPMSTHAVFRAVRYGADHPGLRRLGGAAPESGR